MGTGEFEIVDETSETQTSDNNNNSVWKEEGEEAFSNPIIGIAPGFYEQPTLLIDANGFLAYPNQVIDYNNYTNMLSWFPANDGYLYASPPPPPPELVLPMAAILMNGYYSVNPYAGLYPWNNSNIIPSSLSNPAIGGGALLPSPYPSLPYNILPPLIDDSQHSLKLNDWRIPVDSTEKDELKEIEVSAEPEEEDSWEAGSKKTTAKNILPPLAQVYNRLDFVTKYEDAKFFIIKSYSEDNVRKSLQFGVWSSTPNGNRKLDEAFWDAQRRAKDTFCSCPIFLFFSINRSRQFCGVAEMSGPVDYLKTMGFWEQDKWSGSFPVKWHIVKDVPNSQLRRIVLDGENKPVTNSRDTQEVNISKGIELLRIFKNYPSRTSILDTLKNLYSSSDE